MWHILGSCVNLAKLPARGRTWRIRLVVYGARLESVLV